MSAKKDAKTGKWQIQYRYTDWQGNRKKSTKRGFNTKRDAENWLSEFLLTQQSSLNMSFEAFVEIYKNDMRRRLRENTWRSKEYIINLKILPYFKNKSIGEIKAKDIIAWQNELMSCKTKNGKPYAPTYLRSVHSQLSAIFNHAVKYYNLKSNPASVVGTIGSKNAAEMDFWTKDEYLKFADVMMDKPISYYAFEMLYWCGIRMGELLALTRADFNFDKETVRINKSYQRLDGRDVITDPKTKKSNRIIKMPNFLNEEMKDYLETIYGLTDNMRIFPISKDYLHREMNRGAKEAGVKRIRIHDLRHSHISLLIDMGFTAIAIADRVGHESVEITYRYSHLFPTTQAEMAERLNMER